jgi:PAS domain S-box-containing protein
LEDIVKQTASLVQADAGALILIGEDGLETEEIFAFNIAGMPEKRQYTREDGGVVWEIFDSKRSMLIGEYGSHPHSRNISELTKHEHFAGVPLLKGEKCLGVITFLRTQNMPEFTRRDLNLLEGIGRQAAVAIENARLYTELSNSRFQLQQALEASRLGTWDWDIRTGNVQWSDSVESIFGLAPGAFAGTYQGYLDLIPPEDRPLLEKNVQLALNDPQFDYHIEHRILLPDGSMRWLEGKGRVLRGEQGDPVRMTGTVVDITERKNAEDALRQRDTILEVVTFAAQRFLQTKNWNENIGEILQQLGLATGVSHVYIFEIFPRADGTQAMSQRFEWTAPGVPSDIDNPVYQNLSLDDPGLKRWIGLLQNGELYIGSQATIQPGDAEFMLPPGFKSVLEMPIFVNGVWWGTIGFDDLNIEHTWSFAELEALKVAASLIGEAIQRQSADVSIRQREAILQAVTFAGQQFLQTKNWRLNINAVLERLGQATGASHVYIFENHPLRDGNEGMSQRYEWVAPDQEAELFKPVYQNVPLKSDDQDIWYGLMKQGKLYIGRPIDKASNPDVTEELRSPNLKSLLEVPIFTGEIWWGLIGFDDYVNERKWSLAEMEALRLAGGMISAAIERQQADETLRVAEMTYRRELEQRVKERTAQLETAVQQLEAFSYSTSHDLRAPLRAIDGYSRIVLEDYSDKLGDEGRQHVQYIRQAAQRMDRLIDDLLNYSRLGHTALKIQPVSLPDTIAHLRRDLSARIQETSGSIELEGDLPALKTDPTLLDQILSNLINNGLTYHRPDVQPQVRIRCAAEAGCVVISVADNGIGIPKQYQSKIFNVFQRLHRDDEYEGTGIGLSIVKQAVEMLSGEIWIESEPGRGSTFFVKLPNE